MNCSSCFQAFRKVQTSSAKIEKAKTINHLGLRGPHGGAKHKLGQLVMEEVRTPWFNAGRRNSSVAVLCLHPY